MKKIYFILFILIVGRLGYSQTIFLENFQSGTIPHHYTLYCDTFITNIPYFQDQAWVVGKYDVYDSNNYVAATTSWFSNGIFSADRWMITPAITIPNAINMFLSWRSMNIDPNYEDSLTVLISVSDVNKTSFNDTVYVGADSNIWTNHVIPLTTYVSGQTIHVAFIDQSVDKYILLIDDLQVGADAGINQIIDNPIVNIYPNPTTNFVNIKTNDLIKEIRIFNSIGQLVLINKIKDNFTTLNISDLKQGLYTISIETVKGISVQKVSVIK